jgi:hypothetical protein
MAQTRLPRDALHSTHTEVVVAALLYLVTAYRRCCCPGLAACIARHFQYLAQHPDAHHVIREVAGAATAEWEAAACMQPAKQPTARPDRVH